MKLPIALIACFLVACSSTSRAGETGAITASFNPADERTARDAILERVKAAIAAEDFSTLDEMESRLRTSRGRTPSGLWELAVLHAGLQSYLADGLARENGCQYRQAPFVRLWAKTDPRSPAPIITDAALLLKQAWCFRGTGYADTVPADAWPKFEASVSAAAKALDRHRAFASTDPEFFAVQMDVLRATGVSRATFRAALDEAIASEPDYHRTYFNAAWFFLPQWGGSYAELDAFARFATERTRSSEGDGMYARLFWSLDECGCKIVDQVADRLMLKKAMLDVYNRYPVAWNGQYFADLSCRLQDIQEGRAYIKAIHPEAVGESSFAALYDACDNHAQGER